MILAAAGCGRIGLDPLPIDAAEEVPVDAAPDATVITNEDAAVPRTCPTGSTELSSGSMVCIELTERGTIPWTEAKTMCEADGRRLCSDAEWVEACNNAVGVIDMLDLGWEWVAEEVAGIAQKRGASLCTDMSTHQVIDPYEYRCCLDL